MKLVDKRKTMKISELYDGEVFEAFDSLWVASDYVDNEHYRLCIEIESGHYRFYDSDYIVPPVTVEVHIL